MNAPTRDPELENALAESAHALFERAKPRRGTATDAGAPDLLRSLGAAGFIGLGLDDTIGGSGGTARNAGLVAEVAGAHASAILYLQQLLSAHAAAAAGDRPLTETLLAGARAGALIFEDSDGRVLPTPTAVGEAETLVLRANRYPTRISANQEPTWDETTWLAPGWHDVRLLGDLPALPAGIPAWPDGLTLARGLAAASEVGLVGRLLTDTANYVKYRRQFGVPVGSFQAIKHALADVSIALIHTRALVFGALDSFDARNPEATRLVALAKVAADGTAAQTRRCLQAMGGIGFTWESDVHRYLKQAMRLRQWPQPHMQLRASVRPTATS